MLYCALASLCRGSSVVERGPEKAGVGSSILPLGTISGFSWKRFRDCGFRAW